MLIASSNANNSSNTRLDYFNANNDVSNYNTNISSRLLPIGTERHVTLLTLPDKNLSKIKCVTLPLGKR